MITLLWKTWFYKGWSNELDTVRVGGGGGGYLHINCNIIVDVTLFRL